jgi:hypothetical protein
LPETGQDITVYRPAAVQGRQRAFGDVAQLAWAVVGTFFTVKLTSALGNRSLPPRRANFISLHAANGAAADCCGMAIETACHFAFEEAFHFRRQVHMHGHGGAFVCLIVGLAKFIREASNEMPRLIDGSSHRRVCSCAG